MRVTVQRFVDQLLLEVFKFTMCNKIDLILSHRLGWAHWKKQLSIYKTIKNKTTKN